MKRAMPRENAIAIRKKLDTTAAPPIIAVKPTNPVHNHATVGNGPVDLNTTTTVDPHCDCQCGVPRACSGVAALSLWFFFTGFAQPRRRS
ncbi:hypothetical protein BV898_14078 [Hypsibius exemplaris]|uniref:Uncharacterized protein n=1 Tax=Hypsibius exemplaris TaxID=2072580 RepID=A0A1W0W8X5_HYPEX|nr:hypothetical protein BV898_14078 [Hypsibius exemplaris]